MNCELITLHESSPHHNCALVGVTQEEATQEIHTKTINALKVQQHRGTEAAGIAQSVAQKIRVTKNLGLISQALPEKVLKRLKPTRVEIAHTRYSTAGKSKLINAQPYHYDNGIEFALAHNGNVVWTRSPKRGEPTSDSFGIGQAITEGARSFEKNVIRVLKNLNGAYVLLLLTKDDLFVARDPWGFRPCVTGKYEDGMRGMIVASESVALTKINASIVGRIPRGQFVRVTPRGMEVIWEDPRVKEFPESACTFETTYFAGMASEPDVPGYEGLTNHQVRERLGQRLAEIHVPHGDFVTAVPFSGNSYALGVSHKSGLIVESALFGDRFAGRSFLAPDTVAGHMQKAELKYDFVEPLIKNKEVVITDDSVVRGSTQQGVIMKLLKLGAKFVHVLIGMPPIQKPCFWGIDFADPRELMYRRLKLEKGVSFETAFALWLINNNPDYARKLKIDFQTLDDYVSITRNVPHGTSISKSGGCFHCVGGPAPEGALTNDKMQKDRFEKPN